MQVNRIANKVTKSYLMDPYAMLMHYKRAFKLMDAMKKNSAKVLILGNKNQFGIDWKGRFEGMEFDTGVVDGKLISGATKHYQMILCLDPVLYCRSLHRINLPVMMCATLREITEHPEILDVTDYLLPFPTRRHDAALREIVGSSLDREKAPRKQHDPQRASSSREPPKLARSDPDGFRAEGRSPDVAAGSNEVPKEEAPKEEAKKVEGSEPQARSE